MCEWGGGAWVGLLWLGKLGFAGGELAAACRGVGANLLGKCAGGHSELCVWHWSLWD